MKKIVSLIASSTETVCRLGCEDQLVGRSHECDYPESVKKLPQCSAPRFDIHGSSAEIDARVKETLKTSSAVYTIDAEKLKALKPDVIITQDHCEVCAVSLKDVENAVCAFPDPKPEIVTLLPNNLADVWGGIERIAKAAGVEERGKKMVREFKDRMANISNKVKQRNPASPRVACIEWLEPLMPAGNWVPELPMMAGGINLFGEPGKHSPWMEWEEIRKQDPDIIVTMPCGWDLVKTEEEMPFLTQRPGWKDLKAVRGKKIFLTDGNQFFNRPGPRLVESLEILAEIFYPALFDFGHRGKDWRVFEG